MKKKEIILASLLASVTLLNTSVSADSVDNLEASTGNITDVQSIATNESTGTDIVDFTTTTTEETTDVAGESLATSETGDSNVSSYSVPKTDEELKNYTLSLGVPEVVVATGIQGQPDPKLKIDNEKNFLDIDDINDYTDFIVDSETYAGKAYLKTDSLDPNDIVIAKLTEETAKSTDQFLKTVNTISSSKHEIYTYDRNNKGDFESRVIYTMKGTGSDTIDGLKPKLEELRETYRPKITFDNNGYTSLLNPDIVGHGYDNYAIDYYNNWLFRTFYEGLPVTLKDIVKRPEEVLNYGKGLSLLFGLYPSSYVDYYLAYDKENFQNILMAQEGVYILSGGFFGTSAHNNQIAIRLPDVFLKDEIRSIYPYPVSGKNVGKNLLKSLDFKKNKNPENVKILATNIKDGLKEVDEDLKNVTKPFPSLKKEIVDIFDEEKEKINPKNVIKPAINAAKETDSAIDDSLDAFSRRDYVQAGISGSLAIVSPIVGVLESIERAETIVKSAEDIADGDFINTSENSDEKDTEFVSDIKEYKREYKEEKKTEQVKGSIFALVHKLYNLIVDLVSKFGSKILYHMSIIGSPLLSFVVGVISSVGIAIAGGIAWSALMKKQVMNLVWKNSNSKSILKSIKDTGENISKFLKKLIP